MWADELVQRGIIKRSALERALEWERQTGGLLQDGLWALGALPERDLLHALARRYGLQYCTYDKARSLSVSDEIIDRVPARFVEANQVVAFKIDELQTAWLIVRQPLSEGNRAAFLRLAGARETREILALPAVVKAAIRRHYYRDLLAFDGLKEHLVHQGAAELVTDKLTLSPEGDPLDGSDSIVLNTSNECPLCQKKVDPRAFQCEHCGYVLNLKPAALGDEPDAPSIVLALLSPTASDPNKRAVKPPPPKPSKPAPVGMDDEPATTVRRDPWPDRTAVPELGAGIDAVLDPLSELEAFVASFVDGKRRMQEIAQAAALSEIETSIVLQSLVDREVLVARKGAPPPPARPEPSRPPPPVLVPGAPPVALKPPPPVAAPAKPPPPVPAPARFRPSELQREKPGPPVPTAPRAPPPVALGDEPPASTEVRSVLAMALRHEQSGSLDRAIEVLSNSMERARRPAPLLNRLALILAQRRDFKTAEKLLKRAVALEPKVTAYEKNLFKIIALAAVADLE